MEKNTFFSFTSKQSVHQVIMTNIFFQKDISATHFVSYLQCVWYWARLSLRKVLLN